MSGFYRVSSSPVPDPAVSISEVKTALRIDGDDEDTLIATLIDAAQDDAENLLHRAILERSFTLKLDAFPAEILLPYPLVRSATVHYLDETSTWVDLDNADVALLSGPPSRLIPAYGEDWPTTLDFPDCIQITYTSYSWATPSDVPAGIRQWIIARVGELFEQREANGPVQIYPHPFVRGLLAPWMLPDYGYRHR